MNKEIEKYLIDKFPEARSGFIKTIVSALDIHANKNHDYNSKDSIQKYNAIETLAKFLDIRRKYSRIENIIMNELQYKVNETLEDSAIDLGVYSFLFAEYIYNHKQQKYD